MLNCPKCTNESGFIRKPVVDNVYILRDKKAQCRLCGTCFDFHYGQTPTERDLKAMIYEETDQNLATIERLKEGFFWADNKAPEDKFAVYYNIVTFLKFGAVELTPNEMPPVVLTLWEPWASLYAAGLKQIETRPRPTKWRGPMLIHAAKNPPAEARAYLNHPLFKKALAKLGIKRWEDFQHGHIIGAVDLLYCAKIIHPEIARSYAAEIEQGRLMIPPADPELAFGNYEPNRFGWIGSNHRQLETPIPYANGQGYYLRLREEYDFSTFLFKEFKEVQTKSKKVKLA